MQAGGMGHGLERGHHGPVQRPVGLSSPRQEEQKRWGRDGRDRSGIRPRVGRGGPWSRRRWVPGWTAPPDPPSRATLFTSCISDDDDEQEEEGREGDGLVSTHVPDDLAHLDLPRARVLGPEPHLGRLLEQHQQRLVVPRQPRQLSEDHDHPHFNACKTLEQGRETTDPGGAFDGVVDLGVARLGRVVVQPVDKPRVDAAKVRLTCP